MLFQVYMAVLFRLAGGGVSAEIETLRRHLLQEKFAFVDNLIAWLARIERLLAPLLLLLAVLLGAYTGFLLSALKTYPLLNNPVLPVLFLISGVSSGIASTILLAVTLFKENHHSQGVSLSTASSGRCWRWRCCCWSASLPASTSVAARRRRHVGRHRQRLLGSGVLARGGGHRHAAAPVADPAGPAPLRAKTAIWCWSAA